MTIANWPDSYALAAAGWREGPSASSRHMPIDAGLADRMRRHHRVVDDVIDQIGAGRAAVHMQISLVPSPSRSPMPPARPDVCANWAENSGGLSYVVFLLLAPPTF